MNKKIEREMNEFECIIIWLKWYKSDFEEMHPYFLYIKTLTNILNQKNNYFALPQKESEHPF